MAADEGQKSEREKKWKSGEKEKEECAPCERAV
jgi:hypothetical protein